MNITFVDKVGSFGVLVTALSCPACWPLFASVGSALGLGILLPYEPYLMNYAFPGFMGLTLVGAVLAYRFHKNIIPLIIGVLSPLLALYGFYFGWIVLLMYIGIFGCLVSAGLSYWANRKQKLLCQK